MKILSFKTSGLKNIKKPIEILFCNTTLVDDISFDCKIKTIYGANGVGKSALISSVKLYTDIIFSQQYLLNDSNQLILKNLINFETKKFEFSILFEDNLFSKERKIIRHSISLEFDDITQNYQISKEKLEVQRGRSINDTITVVNYDNKKLFIDNDFRNNLSMNYYADFGRTYGTQSIATYCFYKSLSNLTEKMSISFDDQKSSEIGFLTFVNVLSTTVYLLETDKHERFIIEEKMNNLLKTLENSSQPKKKLSLENIKRTFKIDKYEDVIEVSKFALYKKEMKLLENFLKVFKPSLKEIKVENKPDGRFFRCRKIFVYDKYEVDIEYESSGIKHLVSLHSYLLEFFRGNVVFIDELDTNISSIYLKSLIEFLLKKGKGQLIITTHDLDLMDVLSGERASINAIGFDNCIDTWTRKGNRNPKNYYADGYFEHTPNNVEYFDFAPAFIMEK